MLNLPLRLDRFGLRRRARAAGLHLLISAVVAAIAAGLVFGLWYPGIYRRLAGGRELFLLVSGVDVVLGPLLTFAVFNLKKGWPHLRRDLAVIGLLQLLALSYGMHTVYEARPVALVFEVDRLRVITANQVYLPELDKARVEYRKLPLTGPWLLGTRDSSGIKEHNEAVMMGISGIDIGQRPIYWQSYEESVPGVMARARPLRLLLARYPAQKSEAERTLHEFDVGIDQARFLPAIGHDGDWVAILDAHGRPFHFLPVDGFF
jgi:hypothetical protein